MNRNERIEMAKARIRQTFEYENVKANYLVYDVNYWLFGEKQSLIPPGYCAGNFETMMQYQTKKINLHYDVVQDDCYINFLMPWYGTGVLAGAFGTDVTIFEHMDPAVNMSIVSDVNFIDSLQIPDFDSYYLSKRVLDTIDFFAKNSRLPLGLTDCQGPLTTAVNVIGYENFIYWMHDYPEKIHRLMDLVSDALIAWVKLQKVHMNKAWTDSEYILGVRMPDGKGGVWISDDDAVIFDPDSYREFVVPYNSKVLKAFGGGGIHLCGNGTQHIDSFLATEGLTCLHNFIMEDFKVAKVMKEALSTKKIPLIVCDFSPSDDRMDWYFQKLLEHVDQTGLIISSYICSGSSMVEGKTISDERDPVEVAKRLEQAIVKAIG